MYTRDIRNIVLGGVMVASGLSALAATNLTTFTPNTPIKSSEINANFANLKESVEAPITASRLATTKAPDDGKILRFMGGNLVWDDDLVSNGGGTYTADGSSLALQGTTFAVKERGINSSHLANGSVGPSQLSFPLNISTAVNAPLIRAINTSGIGLKVETQGAAAIVAESASNAAIMGESNSNVGVYGHSVSGSGVQGISNAGPALDGQNSSVAETLRLVQRGGGALIDARGVGGVTVFSVDNKGNVYSATNAYSSDRKLKTNLGLVDTQEVLEKVAAMPVTRWQYKRDSDNTEHIGPMAQDFHKAFGLNGSDDTHINAVDVNGVALAAIQGLYQENRAVKDLNRRLEQRLNQLEAALTRLTTRWESPQPR